MKRGLVATTALIGVCAIPVGASASDDDIRVAGSCDGASSSKIKLKPDGGRIEVEFEVDQNRNGVSWRVRIKDNGTLAFRGNATTQAPSGSFEIERRIADQPGSDKIVAVGVDKSSGERCRATAKI